MFKKPQFLATKPQNPSRSRKTPDLVKKPQEWERCSRGHRSKLYLMLSNLDRLTQFATVSNHILAIGKLWHFFMLSMLIYFNNTCYVNLSFNLFGLGDSKVPVQIGNRPLGIVLSFRRCEMNSDFRQ